MPVMHQPVGVEVGLACGVTRGGRVVFVRFPTSGAGSEVDKRNFPKADFWDVFEKASGALVLHHEDVPRLRGFTTPDWSHLDQVDAARFTGALLAELVDRGILQR